MTDNAVRGNADPARWDGQFNDRYLDVVRRYDRKSSPDPVVTV